MVRKLVTDWGVCHESCTIDEDRPLEVGLQERASNHLNLLWSKAMVVSDRGKGRPTACQVWSRELNESEPLMTCRNRSTDDIKTRNWSLGLGKVREKPADCPDGVRHKGGRTLGQASVWNMGTCGLRNTGKFQVEDPQG
jgi:hypothetical protein